VDKLLRYSILSIVLCSCDSTLSTSTTSQNVEPPTGFIQILHTFTGNSDGDSVRGSLVEVNGRLYGLAGEGGPNGDYSSGLCNSTANWNTTFHTQRCPGTLFSLTLAGAGFRVEHAFTRLDSSNDNTDGYHPYGSLALGLDGKLHGVTQAGGSHHGGVLFDYDPNTLTFNVDHSFCSSTGCADGYSPQGSLAVLSDGSILGTTINGGNSSGDGVAFLWRSPGTFLTTQLTAATTGRSAYGGLTAGPSGFQAVGMTYGGGTNGKGCVIVVNTSPFITPQACFPTFTSNAYGQDNTPIQVPVVLHDEATLFMPREFAGTYGTGELASTTIATPPAPIVDLFEFQNVTITTTPRFENSTGAFPNGQLAEDALSLYGTTTYGGNNGAGALYSVQPNGTQETVLFSFLPNVGQGGSFPYGGLILGTDGALYGTTFVQGTVFKFPLH
jgi:uncharacterized repeat protein (TIGR03803 family)